MEDKELHKVNKNKDKMETKKIKHIKKKYKELFDILENYDKTRELPFHRKRIDITLSNSTISKLKELKEKTGKSISEIIEERVESCAV